MTEQLPVAAQPRILAKRKCDEQVRRAVRKARRFAPHLENPVFLTMLQSFCRISLLLERGYASLRDGSLLDDEGELRSSVDAVRRLAETQVRLAKELGLTPSTLRALAKDKTFDLAAELANVEEAEVSDGQAEN